MSKWLRPLRMNAQQNPISSPIKALLSLLIMTVAGLAVFKLTGQTAVTQGRNDYSVLNTGVIAGWHTWCDDNHILAKQLEHRNGVTRNANKQFLYFDVNSPSQATQIDLSMYGDDISGIHPFGLPFCRRNEIIFSAYVQKPVPIGRVYSLLIGQGKSELLAELPYGRDPSQMFSDGPKYMLATRKGKEDSDGQDNHLPLADCSVSFVRPGYKVMCIDGVSHANIATPKTIVDKDYGHLRLRDTEYKLITDLSESTSFEVSRSLGEGLSPDGRYLYLPCEKRKSTRASKYLSVCRYLLDGGKHEWELVFTFNPTIHERALFSTYSLAWSIIPANSGDVYFIPTVSFLIAYGSSGVWKCSATRHDFTRISVADDHTFIRVSPSGNWISAQGPEKTIVLYKERSRS